MQLSRSCRIALAVSAMIGRSTNCLLARIRRIVEHALLQTGDRVHLLVAQPLGDATFERGLRIIAKIQAAKAENRLEKQIELEIGERAVARGVLGLTAGVARLTFLVDYLFNHTRSNDTS